MPRHPVRETLVCARGEKGGGEGGYSSDGEANFFPSGDFIERVRSERENQDGKDELSNSKGKNPRTISNSSSTSHIY